MAAFVDDSTYQVSSSDPNILSTKLTNQYNKLSEYMGDTGLVINDDKTQLVVMGTRKDKNKRDEVTVDAGTAVVKPVPTGKLLGLHIHDKEGT